MRMSLLYALLACALLAGCATTPFADPPPFVPGTEAFGSIPARFDARLAPRFEQVNAVTFTFRMRQLTALGLVAVDRTARAFRVSCMTPLGVKLFDVVCTNGVAEGHFVHPELARRGGDLAQAVADDLMRAYFDGQPPAATPGMFRRGRLVFTVADARGTTEYRYAWTDGRLAEKVRREAGKTRWSIAYRDYAAVADGLLVPGGLVIDNRHYGYRLVVTTRETRR
jgi:hypothetical protein